MRGVAKSGSILAQTRQRRAGGRGAQGEALPQRASERRSKRSMLSKSARLAPAKNAALKASSCATPVTFAQRGSGWISKAFCGFVASSLRVRARRFFVARDKD